MDDNPEQQLTEKIKHCEKTARNLKKEYESLLQKQKSTDTTGNSENSVTTPLVNDVTKRLKDIKLALKSNQQQSKLTIEQYSTTQSDLPTSVDRTMIQNDDNQMEDAQVVINQQVKPSNDDNGQIEVKLSTTLPEPQVLSNGTLPDDVYLHLISVMGIQECLLRNRLVCSLWNELVLERCRNQKSLKLFETFDFLMEYGEMLFLYEKTEDTSLILKSIGDHLLFEGLETDHEQLVKSLHQDDEGDIQKEVLTRKKKLDASKVLTALYPKIEELVLCPEYDTFIDIEHLLQFYAEQLTSLTMTDLGKWDERAGKLGAFTFPKLKSLNTFRWSPEDDHLLSLLPQLESLTLFRTVMSLETLLRTGTQLRELNIHDIYFVYTAPEEDFSERPPMNTNLRKFSYSIGDDELPVLEFISLNLTSLECLSLELGLSFYPNNLFQLHSLSSNLMPLHQLHSLTLDANVSFFLLDDNKLAQIKPLPSVRHLKLLLWNCHSLPQESMDRFSRSLFTAFPNAEQALIGFAGYEDFMDGRVLDADTLAVFEDFAGKHPNVVQLFRSRSISRCTNFPNAVSPLLGQYRKVYEEFTQEEELFGMSICKLTALLVSRQGEGGPNLKSTLRPADRLAAMSNLLQLLESGAFALTVENAEVMIEHMVRCALKYGPSQGALFSVTTKCILFLIDCSVVDVHDSDKAKPFLDTEEVNAFPYLKLMLYFVEHSMAQQFNDKELLHQLYQRMVKLLKKFDLLRDGEQIDEHKVFKILLKLANYYTTEELNVLDNEEELLLYIHNLLDDQLKKFESENRLDALIRKLVRSKNPLFRVEMAQALTRCCNGTDGYFNLLSGEADSDLSDGNSSDSDSSDSDPSDSSESDSSDSTDSSSAESEPEP